MPLGVILEGIKNCKKGLLDLSNQQLDDKDVMELSLHLKGSEVTALNLSNNNIGAEGIKHLAEHLKDSQLTTLNLSATHLHDEDAKALTLNLKESQVSSLDVSDNSLSNNGVSEWAVHLKNSQVTHLYLANNISIWHKGAKQLVSNLRGSRVHTLSLSGFCNGRYRDWEALGMDLRRSEVTTFDIPLHTPRELAQFTHCLKNTFVTRVPNSEDKAPLQSVLEENLKRKKDRMIALGQVFAKRWGAFFPPVYNAIMGYLQLTNDKAMMNTAILAYTETIKKTAGCVNESNERIEGLGTVNLIK